MNYIFLMIFLGIIAFVAVGISLIAKTPDKDTPEYKRRRELYGDQPNIKRIARWVAWGAGITMVLLTIFMSARIVSARSISVVTAFGQYQTTIKPGLNWIPPWADTESFSTLNQRLDLTDYDDDKGDSVYVTFSAPADPEHPDKKQTAGGGRGNISSEIAWRISEDTGDTGAVNLWKRYVSFDRVQTELVKAKAQDTLGDIANNVPAFEATVNYANIGGEAKAKLNDILKPYGIVVDSVSIKRIDLDPQTQASLQKIVDAINTTAAYAEQAKAAAIQNQILLDRAKVGGLEEKANQRFCLDIVNTWDVKANGPLPATFNCGLGSKADVLVGAGSGQ